MQRQHAHEQIAQYATRDHARRHRRTSEFQSPTHYQDGGQDQSEKQRPYGYRIMLHQMVHHPGCGDQRDADSKKQGQQEAHMRGGKHAGDV
jgi:hypothetical protein